MPSYILTCADSCSLLSECSVSYSVSEVEGTSRQDAASSEIASELGSVEAIPIRLLKCSLHRLQIAKGAIKKYVYFS